MLGFHNEASSQKMSAPRKALPAARLLGYVLTTRHYDPGKEAVARLAEKSQRLGFNLAGTEWDVGYATNPYRVGLWRTLRKLVCDTCEPRRMPFSLLNFEDFLEQALKPCLCKNPCGFDGIAVAKIDQLTSEPKKGTMLVMRLAIAGKHLIADDGICLSCCHPAMKRMLNRS